MNSAPSRRALDLGHVARLAGAVAAGVAEARRVDTEAVSNYGRWIADGRHAAMDYMSKHRDVRDDPRLLLEGARSLIVMAFSYYHPERQPAEVPQVAMYAHGADYHNVLRKRLKPVVSYLRDTYGGDYRICIDSAPLRERYWAVEAGIGFIGLNSQLIVPGAGSYCFIATIVTTAAFEPSERNSGECDKCGKCIARCPGKAILRGKKSIDARRCLSYLTIEAGRTDDALCRLPEGVELGDRIIGCDVCQSVCPHNSGLVPTQIPQFAMRESVRNLTAAQILNMNESEFDSLFAGSAIRRATLSRLKLLLTGHP